MNLLFNSDIANLLLKTIRGWGRGRGGGGGGGVRQKG